MAAFRIFSRFAELLDIKATRAAAAWLRLNNDGTVSERTAAETLGDLGADARYPSINYAGPNPNYPQLTITGVVTAGVNGTLIYCGLINGKAAWSSDGTPVAGLANPFNTLVSSGSAGDIWLVGKGSIYSANKASTAASPVGLTGWTIGIGEGQPVITASATPTGTVIGQLCRSSIGLWRWDGSVWVEVTATASSIPRSAVLAALPSSAPLPIENGGTGGDTAGAARTKLGLGVEQSPTFAGVTVSESGNTARISPLAAFNGGNAAVLTGSAGYGYLVTYGSHNLNLLVAVGQYPRNDGVLLGSANAITWSTTSTITGSLGTSLRQGTAGQILIGTGAAGSFAGSLKATNAELVGTLAVTGASTLARVKATIPNYADDAAADADAGLLSGQLYKITGGRTVYQKP
jgi:hypothetical protein